IDTVIKKGVALMKNDGNLIDKLLNDNNSENDMIKELNEELDKELNKPYEDIDYEKVAELSSVITEISGGMPDRKCRDRNIQKITDECTAIIKRKKIKKIYTWISALSACLILVLSLNIYTMNSFGENLFKTIVRITESGFSLDFSYCPEGTQSTNLPSVTTITITDTTTVTSANTMMTAITISTSLSSPTEITLSQTTQSTTITPNELTQTNNISPIPGTQTEATTTTSVIQEEFINLGEVLTEKCEEAGIVPCFLNYKINMTLDDFSYDKNEMSTDCYFSFSNSTSKLDIIIEQYNSENIPSALIPSNQNGYHAIISDIGEMFLFEEDSHITAVFINNNTIYTTVVHNISLSQLENIIKEYSPSVQN
ncbi:MAG: hypothetical protein K2G83_01505, partial [Ruminococcus sp.]|nr:hypothetical protein [Ruminococcus sp.]